MRRHARRMNTVWASVAGNNQAWLKQRWLLSSGRPLSIVDIFVRRLCRYVSSARIASFWVHPVECCWEKIFSKLFSKCKKCVPSSICPKTFDSITYILLIRCVRMASDLHINLQYITCVIRVHYDRRWNVHVQKCYHQAPSRSSSLCTCNCIR